MPSFCLLGQSYAIGEVEAGANHEAYAAEHVEDAAPDVCCEWHHARLAHRLPKMHFNFLSVFMPVADYAADG